MIKMVIFCVIAFALTWLPFNALILLGDVYVDVWEHQNIMYIWFTTHYLAMCHTITNPLIYIWMNNRFRAGFKQVLGDLYKSLRRLLAFLLCLGCCLNCSRQKYARVALELNRKSAGVGRRPLTSTNSANLLNNNTGNGTGNNCWATNTSSDPGKRQNHLQGALRSNVSGSAVVPSVALEPPPAVGPLGASTSVSLAIRKMETESEVRSNLGARSIARHGFKRICLLGSRSRRRSGKPSQQDLRRPISSSLDGAAGAGAKRRRRRRRNNHAISLQMTTVEFLPGAKTRSSSNERPQRASRLSKRPSNGGGQSRAESSTSTTCRPPDGTRADCFVVDMRQSSQSTVTLSAQTNATGLAISPLSSRQSGPDEERTDARVGTGSGSAGGKPSSRSNSTASGQSTSAARRLPATGRAPDWRWHRRTSAACDNLETDEDIGDVFGRRLEVGVRLSPSDSDPEDASPSDYEQRGEIPSDTGEDMDEEVAAESGDGHRIEMVSFWSSRRRRWRRGSGRLGMSIADEEAPETDHNGQPGAGLMAGVDNDGRQGLGADQAAAQRGRRSAPRAAASAEVTNCSFGRPRGDRKSGGRKRGHERHIGPIEPADEGAAGVLLNNHLLATLEEGLRKLSNSSGDIIRQTSERAEYRYASHASNGRTTVPSGDDNDGDNNDDDDGHEIALLRANGADKSAPLLAPAHSTRPRGSRAGKANHLHRSLDLELTPVGGRRELQAAALEPS